MKTHIILFLFGACGGSLVAAGVYAFISVLGLVPRLTARTRTASHIRTYETFIILGSMAGNIISLFPMDWSFFRRIAPLAFPIISTSMGIFVGSLIMSLAETLDTIPVINRRIHLATGMSYLIAALGVGKSLGALFFFLYEMAS